MSRLIFYLWEDNGRVINIYLKTLVEIISFKQSFMPDFCCLRWYYPVPGEDHCYRKKYIPEYYQELSNEFIDQEIYKMNYALELLIPSSLKEEFYTRFIIWAKEHNYIIFSNKTDSMSSLGYFIPQSYKDFYYE